MKMLQQLLLVLMLSYASLSFAGQVSINQADAVTLSAELNGIGEKKAQAIIDYRRQHGPFKSIDELEKVKGISVKTIEKNRHNLSL